MSDKIIWICGQVTGENEKDWSVHGVFDNEDKAVEACRGCNFFIGPMKLNHELPIEPVEWVGAYYPNTVKNNEQKKI